MPKNLLEWAGIGNEIVLSARKTKIEMWPKEKWNDILDDEPEDFGKLAQSVLGNKKKKSDDVS
jgi:MraZ protein